VLNVTPDSFSDGGRFLDVDAAVTHGLALAAAGADVIDVGGESTRPRGATYGEGYQDVSAEEERARVVPVIERLVAAGLVVSVDTVKAEVAEAAIAVGARYVNDVSMGRSERLLEVCARGGVELVLMHNRGRGEVREPFTVYGDVIADVRDELLAAVERACGFGVARERLWLDPGLGFAKTAAQSGALLAATSALVASGLPVLVGASRKSFLAALTTVDGPVAPPTERLGGSIAAAVIAALAGARAVRVHDVAPTRQALALIGALGLGASELGVSGVGVSGVGGSGVGVSGVGVSGVGVSGVGGSGVGGSGVVSEVASEAERDELTSDARGEGMRERRLGVDGAKEAPWR
jgi:dihydropteroate synthase